MNIIQTKGNSIFWWSVVQFIAERCFGHKKLQMKSISNLSNYQRKSLLRASSTILRLWPCSCCALLGWIPCMPGCGIAAADDAIHGHTHTEWPGRTADPATAYLCWEAPCCTGLLLLWEAHSFDILAVISDFLKSLSPLLSQLYYCQVLLAFCLDLILSLLPSSGPHFSVFWHTSRSVLMLSWSLKSGVEAALNLSRTSLRHLLYV